MELALLLQNNNVQISIEKSKNSAPQVLKYEIECLEERLEKTPEKLSTYTDFCREFDVPEAQNCMKMLHAVAEMGTGDAVTQINHLILHVNEMQNRAEEIRNGKIAFGQKMIFSYPVIAATVKLLIDLTIGMTMMFQMLGNMGGVMK